MRKITITALFVATTIFSLHGQNYEEVAPFGTHHNDWALVVKENKYGFIDEFGDEVVKPQYDEILPFGTHQKGWALVVKENKYGFIDENGDEVVKSK